MKQSALCNKEECQIICLLQVSANHTRDACSPSTSLIGGEDVSCLVLRAERLVLILTLMNQFSIWIHFRPLLLVECDLQDVLNVIFFSLYHRRFVHDFENLRLMEIDSKMRTRYTINETRGFESHWFRGFARWLWASCGAAVPDTLLLETLKSKNNSRVMFRQWRLQQ